MGIIEKLRKQENFTSAESSLADYILANLDEAYSMSLQDLAKASYVSKPSVIRLYRKIGCNSYREFSIGLQLERIESAGADQIDDLQVLRHTASLNELVEKIGILAKQIVDNCVRAIGKNGLDDIVNVINEAEQTYVYADDDIQMEVRSFNRRMKAIGMDPVMINEAEDMEAVISGIGENDVVLVATSNRPTSEDRRISERLFETAALKVLITTQDDPSINYKADYTFYTYPNGNDLVRNNVFVSQMSLLLGLNIIQICLYKIRNRDKDI
jgi:DNA-binding MurR/RpiR family transcriptional regulator